MEGEGPGYPNLGQMASCDGGFNSYPYAQILTDHRPNPTPPVPSDKKITARRLVSASPGGYHGNLSQLTGGGPLF